MHGSCSIFLFLSGSLLLAQRPVVSSGGILSSATWIGGANGPTYLGPGSLASIFGTNLSSGTQTASGLPLPNALSGTTVLVNGQAASLLFVSPSQINFQVLAGSQLLMDPKYFSYAAVVVRTGAGDSDPATITLEPANLGLFSLDGSGCGRAAALNVAADGTTSLNSPDNSASPGQVITLFGTGAATPTDELGYPSLYLNESSASTQQFNYSGPAPGLTGVDQFNVSLPSDALEGCYVPLRVSNRSYNISQPLTISIHQGGGTCVDPPNQAGGLVTLTRTTVAGFTTSNSETLDASFPSSPGRQRIADNLTSPGDFKVPNQPFPSCRVQGVSQLDAGEIRLAGATANTVSFMPGTTAESATYHADLPSSTLQQGYFQITGSGSAGVGPFSLNARFGADLNIGYPAPAAGTTLSIPPGGLLTYFWTGGEPGSIVTVRLISHFDFWDYQNICIAPVEAQRCTMESYQYMGRTETYTFPSMNGELRIEEAPAQPSTFVASGLSLGGMYTWKIVHRFTGFIIN